MAGYVEFIDTERFIEENAPPLFTVLKIDDESKQSKSDSDPDFQIYTKKNKCKPDPNLREVFKCPHCPLIAGKRSALFAHMKSHDPDPTIKYKKCRLCSDTFSNPIAFFNHMFVHGNDQGVPCMRCGKRFRTYSSIKNHKHSTRICTQPFRCKQCSFWSLDTNRMKQHLRGHRGLRPFQCDWCGFFAKDVNAYREHRRKEHLGEKPYVCDYCDESFPLSSELKLHISAHKTEENYFECEICPYKCYAVV